MNCWILRHGSLLAVVAACFLAPGPRPAHADEAKAFTHLNAVMDRYHSQFDVFTDIGAAGNHFAARCAMGNYAATTFDEAWTTSCQSGATCIRNEFRATGANWAGWYFNNGVLEPTGTQPVCNWGDRPNAGFDLRGATMLTFWARGESGGERIEFFAGGIGRDPFSGRPNKPYPDSFPRTPAASQRFTLTTDWQQYEIPLAGLDLSYVVGGFAWVADARSNPSGAVFYLDDIQYDKARLDEPRFLVSFDTVLSDVEFDTVHRNVAFSYDNAIVLLAHLARRTPDDLRRAALLADAFLYAQAHDRHWTDGRLRNAYQAGDLVLPPGWQPNNRAGSARLPGWWSVSQKRWFEDAGHVGSDTGNMAWIMMALLRAHVVFRDIDAARSAAYLDATRWLGRWIAAHTWSKTGAGGFTGGYQGWEPAAVACIPAPCAVTPERRTWKSTEHNIDVYVAFRALAAVTTGDEANEWRIGAFHARSFVRSMWQACRAHDASIGLSQFRFAPGTRDDGATPTCEPLRADEPFLAPEDVNTWGVMALDAHDEALVGLSIEGLEWVETECQVTEPCDHAEECRPACFADGQPATGVDFNDDRDGIWWEGTAHTVIAERIVGRHGQADIFLENLRKAQTDARGSNGTGIVATCHDPVSTGIFGFEFYNRLHIAATGWYAMAELSHNPYWGIGTADPIPPSGPIPAITSISPNSVSRSERITLLVTGSNLSGASFVFRPVDGAEGSIAVDLVEGSYPDAATLHITVAAMARGQFTLVATTDRESSPTQPNGSNTIVVDLTRLVPHVPVVAEISALAEVDSYTFALSERTRVVLEATGRGIQPCVRLVVGGASAAGATLACGHYYSPVARLDVVLAAGEYMIEVLDSGNDQTGGYVFTYEPIVAATATPLDAHVPVVEPIELGGDLDLYTFALTMPTRVVLEATGRVIQPCLRLLTLAGAPAVTGTTLSCGHYYSPVARIDVVLNAGTYLVEVSDASNDQAGSYVFTYEPVVASTAEALVAHQPAQAPIELGGDIDLYTFALTVPTRVVLEATGRVVQPCLRLLTPAGAPALTGTTLNCGHYYSPVARMDVVLNAGIYLVEVSDASNDQAGSYVFTYEPIVAATATPLDAHVPAVEPTELGGDLDLYTFALTTPTRVVLEATGRVIQPCLRLLTPAGAPALTGTTSSCGHYYSPVARIDVVLNTGTYLVEVSDAGNDQAGSYVFTYEPIVAATATPLDAYVPAVEPTELGGDLDLYTFALTTPTRVVLEATGRMIQPCLRLLTPAGAPALTGTTLSCGHYYSPVARIDVVLAAGTYLVEVSDAGNDQAGSYVFTYEPIVAATVTPLEADALVVEPIELGGDLDLYTFALTTPTRVVLEATGRVIQPCLRLLTPAGAPALTGPTLSCGHYYSPVARIDVVLAAGTYLVEVSDSSNDQTGEFTLRYAPVPSLTLTASP